MMERAKLGTRSGRAGRWREQLELQSMALPSVVLLVLFAYLPMWGIVIAFQDYDLFKGIFASPFVGLKHFEAFFRTRNCWLILKNTLCISFLKLLFCFPTPILLALMINEVSSTRVKRVVQTISYLPHFLSWVIVSTMVFSLLSVDNGSVNMLLEALGLIEQPINWMGNKNFFWTILITANVWKGIGYGSIIFLAAISSINPELYEAAAVDGARRMQRMVYITLPSLVPQIIILLILNVSNILSAGFDDIMLLTNSGNNAILNSVSEVLDIHVYKTGVQAQRYSYSTAVGLFKSGVNVLMLVAANQISRSISDTSLW